MNNTETATVAKLEGTETIKNFMLAGKAIFTAVSKKTGTRYTYKVKHNEDRNCWFVSLLTGPENSSDYTYMGWIKDGNFKTTKGSKISDSASSVLGFNWIYQHVSKGLVLDQVEIFHAGRCGRCGRLLTVPNSILTGYGPECFGRM